MAIALASNSCYVPYLEPRSHGRASESCSFSRSISNLKYLRNEARLNDSSAAKSLRRNLADVLARYGFNESAKIVVPTEDLVPLKDSSYQNSLSMHGLNPLANGAASIKRNIKSALFKIEKLETEEIRLREEMKDLTVDESFSWSQDNYNGWKRTIDVWCFVLSFYFRVLFDNAHWTYIVGFTEERQIMRRKKTALWLRKQALSLGPTFIKLGQLSSSRSDIFPREYVDELAKLQDRVPAFSPERAKALIQSELGSPIGVLFKEFEDLPIGAASLGQVHKAILHSGERVVVKVQRPGLKKLFEMDLGNLKLIIQLYQRGRISGSSKEWNDIYEECSKILSQEIDYINEGKNADQFRRNFRNIKWVRVPLIYWDYTTKKVLTMEYVPGTKINYLDQIDAVGYNRSLIASHLIESYLIQILKTGFFHADPHQGNLAIDKDGSIIYYDFGMMYELKSFTRGRLHELFNAIYDKDAEKVLNCLIVLEVLQPTGDLMPVRRLIQFSVDNLLSQLPDQQKTFSTIGEDLFAIASNQPFRFPSNIAFVMRALSNLEGAIHTLDPDLSVAKVAAPYAQELIELWQKQHGEQLVQEMSKHVDNARDYTISMPYRIQRIEEFVKQLESGDLKLHVRVLESERAARRVATLQMATMYTALSGTLLNLGVTLTTLGYESIANGSFLGAGIFLVLVLRFMQEVKTIDDFERMLS